MTAVKLFIISVFGFLIVAACSSAANTNVINVSKPAATTAPAVTPAAVAQITSKSPDKLFLDNCAVCHKETGKGGKITIEGKTIDPDDLTSAKMKAKTDEQLFNYISNGVPDEGMRAFKDKLVEPEIRNLVIHIRSLQRSS